MTAVRSLTITLKLCPGGILITDGERHLVVQDSKKGIEEAKSKWLGIGFLWRLTIVDAIANRTYEENLKYWSDGCPAESWGGWRIVP